MAQTHPTSASSSVVSLGGVSRDALYTHAAVMARRGQRQRRNLVAGMASALVALALGAALGVTLLHFEASAEPAVSAPAAEEIAQDNV